MRLQGDFNFLILISVCRTAAKGIKIRSGRIQKKALHEGDRLPGLFVDCS